MQCFGLHSSPFAASSWVSQDSLSGPSCTITSPDACVPGDNGVSYWRKEEVVREWCEKEVEWEASGSSLTGIIHSCLILMVLLNQ
jgi:hypothetical protein